MTEPGYWTCRHFGLANPDGPDKSNLPLLLRRVADAMESEGIQPLDILDVTVSSDMTAEGPAWSATVYWSPDRPNE